MQIRPRLRLAAGLALGAAGVVPVVLSSPAQAAPEDLLTVNLLHINDHHSHLDPESGTVDLGTGTDDPSTPANESAFTYEMGGWGRVDAMFKQLESDLAGQNPIKIHAGDAITGTPYYTLFGGEADAAMMNQTCFDVFEVGNHEFDDGDEGLATFLDFLNDPDGDGDDSNDPCNTEVLGANVVPAAGTPLNPDPDEAVTDDDYLQPYALVDVVDSNGDTQQVGFIGLDIAQKTMQSSSPLETTEFLDEVETAQTYVDELQGMGVENIVLVTHYQYDNDIALAAQVSGIDAIIGGDSHTLLGDAEDFGDFGFEPDGPYPTEATNADGDLVCIGQAWQYSAIVGHLTLNLQDGVTQSCTGTPHLLVGEFSRGGTPIGEPELTAIETAIAGIPNVTSIAPNQDALDALAVFADQVDELKQQVIGNAVEPLCANRLPGDDRSAGKCTTDQVALSGARADVHGGFIQQIVADAFLARAFRSDIAIQNAGGVREVIDAGPITMDEAIKVLPFSNTLVELDLTGQQVVDTLEDAVANFLDNPGGSNGSYPYGAAIRWDVDLTKPAGQRFTNVEVRDRETGEWSPIDLEATYVVVTNDFIARGQDGYTTFGEVWDEGNYVDTGILYTQGLLDWIEQDAPQNEQGVPQVSVPEPEDFSTQSFVGPEGELMAPVNPTRVLDTRPQTSPTVGTTFDGVGQGGGPILPQAVREVQIGGRSVVPPTATAISVNVTATDATGQGYFTIWPCNGTKPVASSVNFDAGQNIANSVVVPLSDEGTLCISAGVSSAHAVVDVTGWSASSPDYLPLGPSRLLDTRPETSPTSGVTIDGQHRGQGLLDPGERLVLPVVGRANVPTGTTAVTLNLTATGAVGPGYLTAYPCDVAKPLASTLNYADPRAIANSIVVPLAADGTLCIESGVSGVHVVADVTGAYNETEDFGGLTPARLIDTRAKSSATIGTTVDGEQEGGGPLVAGEMLEIQVTGRGGEGNEVPEDARLVALNLTATEGTGPGYFTAWPCDQDRPVASSVNYLSPTSVANSVIVDLSAEGTVCVFAGVNSAHVVADVTAFYR